MTSSSIPTAPLPGTGTEYTWGSNPPLGKDPSRIDSEKPATAVQVGTPSQVASPADGSHSQASPSARVEDSHVGTTPNTPLGLPPATAPGERMNATFVTLARNSDIWEIAKSIRQVEDRFNRKFHYDWVFLNDQPFDEEFKKLTTALVSGKTYYGEIPHEHWSFPNHIDQAKAQAVREDMAQRKIIYGDSISYRHMCRYESGFFFRHPLMNQFEWYWRVEPSVELYCDINYDTFKYMADNGKKYSFVLSLYEYMETIPTLWDSVKNFMEKHPEHIKVDNLMGFLSDDGGKTYNRCHFVSVLKSITVFILIFPSGQISRLVTSTGSDRKLTWTTSTLWTRMVDSFTRGGAMPLCTPLRQVYCLKNPRFTSSTISHTIMCLSRTAQPVRGYV